LADARRRDEQDWRVIEQVVNTPGVDLEPVRSMMDRHFLLAIIDSLAPAGLRRYPDDTYQTTDLSEREWYAQNPHNVWPGQFRRDSLAPAGLGVERLRDAMYDADRRCSGIPGECCAPPTHANAEAIAAELRLTAESDLIITHLPAGENLALCEAEIGDICSKCLDIDERLIK
jgi:hypothetical protein